MKYAVVSTIGYRVARLGDQIGGGQKSSWLTRWRNLDINHVVEAPDGYWVDYADLSKVEEIGFTDASIGIC